MARLSMHAGNPLELGLFGANCSGGRSLTRVPERWRADWDETLAMAQLADEFPYLRDEALPRLERAGVRHTPPHANHNGATR
jgi:hypothetical protein